MNKSLKQISKSSRLVRFLILFLGKKKKKISVKQNTLYYCTVLSCSCLTHIPRQYMLRVSSLCHLWGKQSHLNVEVEAGRRRVSIRLAFQCHIIAFLNGARRQNLQVHLLSGVWKMDDHRGRQSMKAWGKSASGKGAASARHIRRLGSVSGAVPVIFIE